MMPGKIEKAEMLPILVRAEERAEKADALYKQMHNFIWAEHERGEKRHRGRGLEWHCTAFGRAGVFIHGKGLGGTYWKSWRLTRAKNCG